MASPIKQFYEGKSVFISGGSGFLGKVLIIKLLTSCPNIAKIYILLRAKRNLSSEDRLKTMLESKPFTLINLDRKQLDKVVAIDGDISKHQLGISLRDRQTLCEEVNIVFHSAATVRFEETLKLSVEQNIVGTKRMLELCQEMKNILCFVHVSTAYAHCQYPDIEEKLYSSPMKANDLIKLYEILNISQMNALRNHIIGDKPNTYTFTKGLAEEFIFDQQVNFPIAIVRPSIIINGLEEPVPGWSDSPNGANGLGFLLSYGLFRTMKWNANMKTDLVPVDFVVNCLISVAWGIINNNSESKSPIIFNFATTVKNPVTWIQFFGQVLKSANDNPPSSIKRPSIKAQELYSDFGPLIQIFSEYLFAYICDFVSFMTGSKRVMVRTVQKMIENRGLVHYFTVHEWNFDHTNTNSLLSALSHDDKKEFNFDMNAMDWKQMATTFHMGNRRYFLKESDKTIPDARKRFKKLKMAYRLLNYVLLLLLFYVIIRWTPIGTIIINCIKLAVSL